MSYFIKISNRQRRLRLNRKGIEKLVGYVLAEEGVREGEVSLLLLNNDKIRHLNRQYLGRDYPTDVLAFPQNEGSDQNIYSWFLGDVVLSTERIAHQAPEHGQSVENEFALCLIHGILHLLGYSDEPPERREVMRLKEEEILRIWKGKKSWSTIRSYIF
ncbi:MAG: rRNA maturation RNase YbeY [Candidatus Auribacterota bacterium]|nr:rRNA maturation RNase YbeY [Candidatus Auribacterota bacterium]